MADHDIQAKAMSLVNRVSAGGREGGGREGGGMRGEREGRGGGGKGVGCKRFIAK